MIRNELYSLGAPDAPRAEIEEFWPLGPNITGYPGGYPNGFIERVRSSGYWGLRRLHLCSGSVHDGVTVDVNPKVKPTVVADLDHGVPFDNDSFDLVLLDPPYNAEYASSLYGVPLVNVPRLLKEAVRVARPGGWIGLLDFRCWTATACQLPVTWVGMHPVYLAARGNPTLRAFCVYRKNGGRRLETWTEAPVGEPRP